MPRYKLAIQVVYGELKGQGIRVTSKCLWDANFDNYASFAYHNVYFNFYNHLIEIFILLF